MGKELGDKILFIIRVNGTSQREISKKVGMTEQSISRYVNGTREPSAKALKKIADELGVSIDFLMDDDNQEDEHPIINKYQDEAARFINYSLTEDEKRQHALLGLASECGELLGIYQKTYQGHELDRMHIIKECGDIMWMLCEFLSVEGIDLDDVMKMNIRKLSERYPNGFEPEKSLHRKAGDI